MSPSRKFRHICVVHRGAQPDERAGWYTRCECLKAWRAWRVAVDVQEAFKP